ncbi:NADP-dependent malic enzyme [Candidatus Falkowbacteria bacterium]|nr:NADP-dependent malic enzyme [Candidatus Falkowbacteria bacterium]
MDYFRKSVALHKKKRGKIEMKSKVTLKSKGDLALAYTPGVAEVCREINSDPKMSWQLTNRANQVAVISDGTAILGLGDLGPEAAMPVMEGKAVIFKEFANIDAIPLCIASKETEEIISFCKMIAPSFGGINLEDISAPRCFEILERLEKELSIPVFHDDQDGTAIITLAALINACRVTGKVLNKSRVVVNGAGAAGAAIAHLLLKQGVDDLIVVDSIGIVYAGRPGLNKSKKMMAKESNKNKMKGGLAEALVGSDVFVGVSKADLLTEDMVRSMNAAPIIFAMANPNPEIMPEAAFRAGASIVGTGRSDLPNQINNALVFPGLFRGLLDSGIKHVTLEMKQSVAMAIAYSIKPSKNKLLPLVTDRKVVKVIRNTLIKNKEKYV